ncbi:ubiquinol-cytochrome c reductase iron-sulfur subunit [Hamadaea flava]|uniref:Cytochrome bc1 complex Rieske iron-sulfur subunit n=1 Tax=Hamadaea flava TaxID=1742688 RepID=A0ABV8LV62_9ACTN|nr:Rieske 2Fe-2S domain-containing protein [Hamadaea flava]MCP2327852.1 ubiquinol-cytochrome c reductase iron-sulfur subunit [Hamadaea flava]
MSNHETTEVPGGAKAVDPTDPNLTYREVLDEGLRRDEIEIVHYEPQFPVPGTKAEKRVERLVAFLLLLCGLAAIAFVVIYVSPLGQPKEYHFGTTAQDWFTPLLGFTLGLSLFAIGMAILVYGKKLLPHEIAIQQRHNDPSSPEDRALAAGTLGFIGSEFNIQRRPLIKGALGLGGLGLGAAAVAVPVGMLLKDPHKGPDDTDPYMTTGWNAQVFNDGKPVRMVLEDNTYVRPEDISTGGQITVFPGLPGGIGVTNEFADSPVLLIHLRDEDAQTLRDNLYKYPVNAEDGGSMWNNFVAYSKICTHAGCPASLYEQQTNRLLCPCHQSQFLITDNARPIFGPAARRLPMLAIGVDDEGYLFARRDFDVSVGPAYWERPSK